MSREIPAWALPDSRRRRAVNWATDLGTLARRFRWGRPRQRPANAPAPAKRVRSDRRTASVNPYLWLVHHRYVVQVSGVDAVTGLVGPVVVASNHQSLMDRSILRSALPLAWRLAGRDVDGALAAGRSVLVFPEGEPSPTGALGRFSARPAELAAQHNLPVIPVAITGTFNLAALLRLRGLRSRPVVRIRVGSPLYPRSQPLAQAADSIRAAVADLLAEDSESWWDAKRRAYARATQPGEEISTWRRTWHQSTAPTRPAKASIWRSVSPGRH